MIWDYSDALARRLLLWSASSAAVGAIMVTTGGPFWRGFGVQALAWGAIDAGVALLGRRAANRKLVEHIREGKDTRTLAQQEVKSLRRLLWINAGLDMLYVAGGAALANTLGRSDPFSRGNGWGIAAQGGFLLLFDLLHALGAPQCAPAMPAWNAFGGEKHRPFFLQGGRPGAVLLHGFLGTPAEVRGLGEALHAQGWTVAAPLLPGFGSEIDTLGARRWQEWAAAVEKAVEDLKAGGHDPVLLVGFSMGAALALAVSQRAGVSGIALLAPFAFAAPWWLGPVEFFVRPFLPLGFRPLRKADFSNSQLRAGIGNFMPDLDLDDPAVQAAMRDFRVPLGLIDQVRGFSRAGLRGAGTVDAPVLVVQGKHDQVARAMYTKRLVSKLPQTPEYVEVDSDHNLTDVHNPAWPQVRQAVLDFAAALAAKSG